MLKRLQTLLVVRLLNQSAERTLIEPTRKVAE